MNRLASTKYIAELATKEGLDTVTITKIVKSQFEFLAEVMASGDREKLEFKTLMIANLGKFASTDGRINKIKAKALLKNESIKLRERSSDSGPQASDNTGV